MDFVVTIEFFASAVQIVVCAPTKQRARVIALQHPHCAMHAGPATAIFVTREC
jgi:hypothetical protein